MAPIALGVEVAQPQFAGFAGQNPRHTGGDLARHEFVTAPRRLVVEQNAAGGVHAIGFAVIPRQIESRYLADAIAGAGMKSRPLVLRHFFGLAEHFARAREIEPAIRRQVLQHRQQDNGCR